MIRAFAHAIAVLGAVFIVFAALYGAAIVLLGSLG